MPLDLTAGEFLARLVAHGQEALLRHAEAPVFLRQNGLTDAGLWDAFQLGVAETKWLQKLTAEDNGYLERLKLKGGKGPNQLRDGGVFLPTYDPQDSTYPVGLIKICFGQNKHRFLTPPAGIAIKPSEIDSQKIILADTPLLGLRVAQAGCNGIALLEDCLVLPQIKDWLASKELFLVSYKESLLRQREAIFKAAGFNPTTIQIHFEWEQTAPERLELLGLKNLKPMTTPVMIHELVRFAQARLKAGLGHDQLRRHCLADPILIDVLGIGYLPSDFLEAFPKNTRKVWDGFSLADRLIIPAFDVRGIAVDLVSVDASGGLHGLLNEPQGLIGARIIKAYDQVILTDRLTSFTRHNVAGSRNTLLLRGLPDVRLNAARMAASGVKGVRLDFATDASEYEKVFRASGLEILGENPAASANPMTSDSVNPTFIGYDDRTDTASYQYQDAKYVLECPLEAQARIQIRLERAGQTALDRFDLASAAQRQRFANSAAMRTKLDGDQILEHLLFIWGDLQRLRTAQNSETVQNTATTISPAEVESFKRHLSQPDLLETIARDLDALGWVGEERNKKLLYLVAVSRKLERPLSAALIAPSGSGKSFGLETLATLVPPEDLLQVSRLSDSSLYHQGQEALRHKLLLIDEADALTPEVIVSLRVLQSRGALSQTIVERDPATGQSRSRFRECKGPLAVLTSTASKLETQILSRCLELPVDDSAAQTRRILDAQLRLRSDLNRSLQRDIIIQRHRNLQRMLEPKRVCIPFADRIEFPGASLKYRRLLEKFLNLIEASALLHQHQRLSEQGVILADVRDFEIASELAADLIAATSEELSPHASILLKTIKEAGLALFTMQDIKILRPTWSRYACIQSLVELLRLELLTSPQRGRGKLREYSVVFGAISQFETQRVLLRPIARNGTELLNLTNGRSNNLTSVRAIG